MISHSVDFTDLYVYINDIELLPLSLSLSLSCVPSFNVVRYAEN